MKRPIRPEEQKLWAMVAATVHPHPGRKPSGPAPPAEPAIPPPPKNQGRVVDPAARLPLSEMRPALRPPQRGEPEGIEPRRKHRIAKERDPIGARIDLHGMDQSRAKAALEAFVLRAWDEGYRAVLVITGKGTLGDGVLRRRAPEWLGGMALRGVVAGISEAHRRHGGEGALYVALKRKPRR
ncbi:Smr/MutS family protein [Phenylobacterium sp.]|uniref:Smr/MutS family protein n=1 Tax=Phenylobacterium sp. TaxID=1871053 RepID=UPI00289BE37F|nr:Smr/MutS family protein [Phenylobacterium sp.]